MPATSFRRVTLLGAECLEERRLLALTWTVTFDDPGKAHAAYYSPIRDVLLAAGADWSRYFPKAKANVQVAIEFAESDKYLATGGSQGSEFFQHTGGFDVWEGSAANKIRTGKDPNGALRDAVITLENGSLGDFWFDPTPYNRDDEEVPDDKYDVYSLLLHELGHCLGFEGFRDWTSGKLKDNDEMRFDRFVTIGGDGTPYFNGPAAKAQYGNQPVPLTYGDLYHLGNDDGRPGVDLINDLMTGTGMSSGMRQKISTLDVAVLKDMGLPVSLQPTNTPPLLGTISDQTLEEDFQSQVPLVMGDLETAPDSLVITTTSNNASLFPPGSMTVSGSGGIRTLLLSPVADRNGSATITVTVSDNSASVSRSFHVTVTPRPDPPAISSFLDQAILEDGAASVSFIVGAGDSPPDQLVVSATASDPTVFPPGHLVITGTGDTRTLVLAPAPNQSSPYPITINVTASDGRYVAMQQFQVTVQAVNDPPTLAPIADEFIAKGNSADVSLSASDAETPANQLAFTAQSSNPSLLPSQNIHFAAAGDRETLSLVPRGGQEGTAVVTVGFSDGQSQASQSFNVRVATNPYPWRNAGVAVDVDNSGVVSPVDALIIIDRLNRNGAGPLAWREAVAVAPPYYDVVADNLLEANDALAVIDYINERIAQNALEDAAHAEGESPADDDMLLAMTLTPSTRRRA